MLGDGFGAIFLRECCFKGVKQYRRPLLASPAFTIAKYTKKIRIL